MRFDFYSNVTSNIEQEKLIMNVFCVKYDYFIKVLIDEFFPTGEDNYLYLGIFFSIETNRLIEALKNHCYEWKCNLGAQLTFDTRLCMNKISDTILVRYLILCSLIYELSSLKSA